MYRLFAPTTARQLLSPYTAAPTANTCPTSSRPRAGRRSVRLFPLSYLTPTMAQRSRVSTSAGGAGALYGLYL